LLGHLEAISSGPALARLYTRLAGDNANLTALDVISRAETDPIAAEAVTLSAQALGEAIGGLVNVIDPDLTIIAGGVSGAGKRWWGPVRRGVRNTALPVLANLPVVPAVLGQDAAVIGAATIALQERSADC
jgi:glucokinase